MTIITRLINELPPLSVAGHYTLSKDDDVGCALSLLIPARSSSETIHSTIISAHKSLQAIEPDFEIVVIPNPKPGNLGDNTEQIARTTAEKLDRILVAPYYADENQPEGKGAALRAGFAACRGRYVAFTDSDLPYDLSFLAIAMAQMKKDSSLGMVSGNRRLSESEFDVPVTLLPLAYGRHRLGLLFNFVVRMLLPINTTDTQAGIKIMKRELAELAFSKQTCPGFFFDLEHFLTAKRGGYGVAELPVRLKLKSEKSTIRLAKEAVLTWLWIFKIRSRYRTGGYAGKGSSR